MYIVYKLNSNSTFFFFVGTNEAISQWNNALGTSVSTSTSTSAGIKYYGGTKEELENLSIWYSLSSSSLGITSTTSTSNEGTYTYISTIKTGKILYKVNTALVDRGMTSEQCKKTATHELGHSLGYYGHDSTTSSVMKQGLSSDYILSSRDKNHLKQVY